MRIKLSIKADEEITYEDIDEFLETLRENLIEYRDIELNDGSERVVEVAIKYFCEVGKDENDD